VDLIKDALDAASGIGGASRRDIKVTLVNNLYKK
jgi:hypothetical protein